MQDFRYKAFISYSHRDESWARWLHRSLETYRIPKRLVGQHSPVGPIPARLTPIFRDRDELATATNLGDVIKKALSESESLLVVCSPTAANSRWVNEEIRYFRQLGRGDRIFCLIVDGEPHATSTSDSKKQECFPAALQEPIDGDTESERVAADVRPGTDGKPAAKLKLIAGMLGVGLDELRQRENQRRQKRLMAITSGAVAGMIIAAGLATAAMIARAEADRQRVRAEQETETARQTSEFLVSLFDVVDPGEARGNEIKAREILDRGAEKIERDLLNQPVVRANLLGTMGRVYTGLGLYDQATTLLDSALEAVASNDTPPERRIGALTSLAQTLYLRGEYDRSGKLSADAVSQARALAEPTDLLVSAIVVHADVLSQQGEDAEAEQLYREAITLDATLHDAEGAERARALEGLGISLLYQGRLDEASTNITSALTIRERVLGEDHPLTIEAINNLAAIAYARQDLAEAERLMQAALPRARRVYGTEHPQTSSMLNNLGRCLLERDSLADAKRILTESVAVDRLLKKPGHDDFAFSLNNLGLVEASLGNKTAAELLYSEALMIARKTGHRMEGPILVNMADLMCTNGDTKKGIELTGTARSALADHYPVDDWRFAYLMSVEGACHARAGQADSATSLLRSGFEKLKTARNANWFFARLANDRLEAAEAIQ